MRLASASPPRSPGARWSGRRAGAPRPTPTHPALGERDGVGGSSPLHDLARVDARGHVTPDGPRPGRRRSPAPSPAKAPPARHPHGPLRGRRRGRPRCRRGHVVPDPRRGAMATTPGRAGRDRPARGVAGSRARWGWPVTYSAVASAATATGAAAVNSRRRASGRASGGPAPRCRPLGPGGRRPQAGAQASTQPLGSSSWAVHHRTASANVVEGRHQVPDSPGRQMRVVPRPCRRTEVTTWSAKRS